MEPGVVGVVLCGGASRRMGVDKALVDIDGAPMLQRVLDALSDAGATKVVLVGERRPSVVVPSTTTWVADSAPRSGPLGGLLDGFAALREMGASDDSIVLTLACDHPALDPSELQALADLLRGDDGADAVVPTVEARSQPLHAAYRLNLQPALSSAFASGERSLLRALEPLQVRWPIRSGSSYLDVDDPASLALFRAQVAPKIPTTIPESTGFGPEKNAVGE